MIISLLFACFPDSKTGMDLSRKRFHRSQFLWWILDIYKTRQGVHENFANSAISFYSSADLIFLLSRIVKLRAFCCAGLAIRFGAATNRRRYVNAVCWLMNQCQASKLRRLPLRLCSRTAITYLLIGFMLFDVLTRCSTICIFFAHISRSLQTKLRKKAESIN